VSIYPRRTEARLTLLHDGKDEVLIECVLTDGFDAACDALAEYLVCFSLPINSIFRAPEDTSKQRGQINLETFDGMGAIIILWVYGNVFVRMELLESGYKSTLGSDKSFYLLADKLHHHIKSSAVQTRNETTVPNISEVKGPTSVTAGKTFVVEITLDDQYFQQVRCDSGVSHGFVNHISTLLIGCSLERRLFDVRRHLIYPQVYILGI